MELELFANQEKSELSMIEVARAILAERGRGQEMYFSDLVNDIQDYLGKSDSRIRQDLALFYSELNTDGSFIPLGDNKWGLRSWYGIDEIDEEVIALEDEFTNASHKQINALQNDDIIDYNNDDPEDEDTYTKPNVSEFDDESDEEMSEVAEIEDFDDVDIDDDVTIDLADDAD